MLFAKMRDTRFGDGLETHGFCSPSLGISPFSFTKLRSAALPVIAESYNTVVRRYGGELVSVKITSTLGKLVFFLHI